MERTATGGEGRYLVAPPFLNEEKTKTWGIEKPMPTKHGQEQQMRGRLSHIVEKLAVGLFQLEFLAPLVRLSALAAPNPPPPPPCKCPRRTPSRVPRTRSACTCEPHSFCRSMELGGRSTSTYKKSERDARKDRIRAWSPQVIQMMLLLFPSWYVSPGHWRTKGLHLNVASLQLSTTPTFRSSNHF